MATAIEDDDEEFVNCGVCFHRYDLEDKKPKFLQCSHSLCLSCVKGILNKGNLRCPFCRCTFLSPNVEILPNNKYAIRMLRLKEKSKETTSETSQRKLALWKKSMLSWCSDCQSAGNLMCTGLGHLMIDLNFETVKKMEDMIKERTELMKLKEMGMSLLAQIIQKRRSIEKRLSLVMESIHTFEEGVKNFQDDNNFKLTKALSILDLNKQSASEVSQKEKDGLFISELISMIEDSSEDDTIETLKLKMSETLITFRENLQEATWTASGYDVREKLKIAVISNNETERPILTQTLTENDQSEQDVILLSEIILCVLDRKNLLPTILKNIKPNSVTDNGRNSVISSANVNAEPTNGKL